MDFYQVTATTGSDSVSTALWVVYSCMAIITLWGLVVVWRDKHLLAGHKVTWTILLLLFQVFAFIALFLWKIPTKRHI